jgi:hypothetical protein
MIPIRFIQHHLNKFDRTSCCALPPSITSSPSFWRGLEVRVVRVDSTLTIALSAGIKGKSYRKEIFLIMAEGLIET